MKIGITRYPTHGGSRVIATQTGGLPEVVVDGHTGFLFPGGEVQAMATQAIELLRNEALLKQFRTAAQFLQFIP